jgi:hypothetical protein
MAMQKSVLLSLCALLGGVPAASATTLVRQSLGELVSTHQTIVVGEVLEANSYWNPDHTFILTDLRIGITDAVKGDQGADVITVTLLGGSVDDLTTLIVGGAKLELGRSYLLFLNLEGLPGNLRALTVREHVQGAFDVNPGRGGDLVAQSQATRHPLQGDERGIRRPVGGDDGMPLDRLLTLIRTIDRREAGRKEVR